MLLYYAGAALLLKSIYNESTGAIKSAVLGKVNGLEKEDLEEVPKGQVILAPLLSEEERKKIQSAA